MNVTINGESRDVPEGLNVAALLAYLGLPPERVAIERNLEILPRAQWEATRVQPGDRYEIVHFVGGGSCRSNDSRLTVGTPGNHGRSKQRPYNTLGFSPNKLERH